jgi:hypothetical protein
MQLRSGTTTDGRTPPSTPQEDKPENIEVVNQGTTEEQAQGYEAGQDQGQIPAETQGVCTGGAYPATYLRTSTSLPPPGTPAYRPPQLTFITSQAQQGQPEYRSAKSHEDSDGSESTKPTVLPTSQARNNMRALTFEAPMRPLDVARSMYLDYTTTQSIKFYNKGMEKLPGEQFNGKLLLTWLV